MKYRIFFLQVICIILLCSCSNQKRVESIKVLNHQTIDLGDQFLGYGGFLTYCQGTIVGIEFNPALQPFFCLETDNSNFFFFGNKGRGPNEFLMPYSIQYIDNQTIGVFDIMSNTYSEFTPPGENEALNIETATKLQTGQTRIIKTAFNQYINLSLSSNGEMFSLTDSTGMLIKTFFEPPYQNSTERKLQSRSFAYQGTLTTNSSKDKFVYTSFYGEIIHFYAIEDNSIEVIAKIENEYPLYKESDDEGGGVIYDAQGKSGYIAAYATENFVYAIYSGQTLLEQTEKRSVNFEGNILRIFNWDGSLVKEYELDVLCSYLCVSDDDSTIWAIASKPDQIALVSFELGAEVEKKQSEETRKMQDVKVPDANPVKSERPTGTKYRYDVRTTDNQQNEQTRKILDSIQNLPANVQLDLGNRFDTRIETDTINNTKTIVLILK